MKRTVYLEKSGIRVEGCRNKTEARKEWEAARDHFVDRSTACPPWVFAFRGLVVMVQVERYRDNWSYLIVDPATDGTVRPQCVYGAKSQVEAITSALGALAQRAWSPEIADDAAYFDQMLVAARITAHEARQERADFLHVAAFWRAHQLAAAEAQPDNRTKGRP